MVLAPSQGPTFFLLEFQHTAALSVDLKNVEHARDVDQAQSGAVAVDSDDQRQWLPEQLALLGDMRQCESPEHSALPANDQHLLGHRHSADDILRLLGVVKLIDVIDLVDVRLVVHEPADLPSHLAIAHLRGGLKHGQSGGLALVLPHVDVVLGAGNDMGLRHAED